MLWLVSLPLLLVSKVIAHCLSHLSEAWGVCLDLVLTFSIFFLYEVPRTFLLISEVPWTFNESILVLSACRNFLSY